MHKFEAIEYRFYGDVSSYAGYEMNLNTVFESTKKFERRKMLRRKKKDSLDMNWNGGKAEKEAKRQEIKENTKKRKIEK